VSLKFLLDEDISYRVAEGLRLRAVDALSVHELGRLGMSDEQHLEFATAEGRVLVTYNRADFQALDAQWWAHGRGHAGIFWCSESSLPRRAIGDLVRALEAVAHQFESLETLCLPLTYTEHPEIR
jgi:predicted nuclease of predicted toxin-antitoxin system